MLLNVPFRQLEVASKLALEQPYSKEWEDGHVVLQWLVMHAASRSSGVGREWNTMKNSKRSKQQQQQVKYSNWRSNAISETKRTSPQHLFFERSAKGAIAAASMRMKSGVRDDREH